VGSVIAINTTTFTNEDDSTFLLTSVEKPGVLDEPALTSDYAQACNAYREFLLGLRDDNRGQSMYSNYYTFGTQHSEFTVVDINHDGIPELHFRARQYTIYTYLNGEIVEVATFNQNAELLNNLAVFSDYWADHKETSATYKYVEFGEDLRPSYSLFFDYDTYAEIYRVMYGNQDNPTWLSEQAFYAITTSIINYCTDPRSHDMIQWENYAEWLSNYPDEYSPREDIGWPR